MDACSSRFTAAEGGARLAAAAAARNTLAVDYSSFIATRLVHEDAHKIRGSLFEGRQRSVYVTRPARIAVVAHELNILTDLAILQGTLYSDVRDWREELDKKEVLVCTSVVLKQILEEDILTMSNINVLILDSCHLVSKDYNLQYIMKHYKACEESMRPRILALTYPLFASTRKEDISDSDSSDCEDLEDDNLQPVVENDSEKLPAVEKLPLKEDTDLEKEKLPKIVETDVTHDEKLPEVVEEINDVGTEKALDRAPASNDLIHKVLNDNSVVKDEEEKSSRIEEETDSAIEDNDIENTKATSVQNELDSKSNENQSKTSEILETSESKVSLEVKTSIDNEGEKEIGLNQEKTDSIFNKRLEKDRTVQKEEEIGTYVNLDDFEMYEKLEWKIEELERELCCQMDLAEDIDGGKRLSGTVTKPKELIIEYNDLPSPEKLPQEYLDLEGYMRATVDDALAFINEHRYDPTEIYGEDMYEEFLSMPDPTVEPRSIFKQFLYILDQLGPYAADKAAFSLLTKLEKLKIKVPYERHFLLLCLCTSVFVQIRCYADLAFSRHKCDWDNIKLYSTPKVMRLSEILEKFQPPELGQDYRNNRKEGGRANEMLKEIDGCDFVSLGNKIEDKVNVIEGNLKDIDDYNVQNAKDTKVIDNNTTNSNIDTTNSNIDTTNSNIDTTNSNIDTTNSKNLGNEEINSLKCQEVSSPQRAFFRRNGNRTRGRGRPVRHASKALMTQQSGDSLCGIVFVKDALVAKIMFMLIVDMSRSNPKLEYLCAQYCAVEAPQGAASEPRECQRQGKKQEDVLKKFRMHECNLLLANAALEEGIDLPRCNLVLRWDVPPSYRSYGLCRARARAPRAACALLAARPAAILRTVAVYRELDQIISRKCGCGIQDEPPQSEEDHADLLTQIVKPYAPVKINTHDDNTDNNPDYPPEDVIARDNTNCNPAYAFVEVNARGNTNRYSADAPADVNTHYNTKCNPAYVSVDLIAHDNTNYNPADVPAGVITDNANYDPADSDSSDANKLVTNFGSGKLVNETGDVVNPEEHSDVFRNPAGDSETNCEANVPVKKLSDDELVKGISDVLKVNDIADVTTCSDRSVNEIGDVENPENNSKVIPCSAGFVKDIGDVANSEETSNLIQCNDKLVKELCDVETEICETKGFDRNKSVHNETVPKVAETSEKLVIRHAETVPNSAKIADSNINLIDNTNCDTNALRNKSNNVRKSDDIECPCLDSVHKENEDTDRREKKGDEDIASVDLSTAIALINRYCGKLPSDTFTRLAPQWWMEQVQLPARDSADTKTAYICTLRLPLNCPVKYNIVGHPMPTRVLARRMAALQACRILHKSGELDDQLMPIGKENFKAVETEATTGCGGVADEPDDSARPGTTKRRQYYYKRTAWAFTDCQPVVDTSDTEIDPPDPGEKVEPKPEKTPEVEAKNPDPGEKVEPKPEKTLEVGANNPDPGEKVEPKPEKTPEVEAKNPDPGEKVEPKPEKTPEVEAKTGTKRNMLYAIVSKLWCALPERYNTRGRRLHAPQHASQAIGILMARDEPDSLQIPAFPVYTRSGEVRVSVEHVPGADVRVSPRRGRLVRRFMRFVFAEVLRVRRRGMRLQSDACGHNDYYVVPTHKTTAADGSTKTDIDWAFLELIYQHTEAKKHSDVEKPIMWHKDEEEDDGTVVDKVEKKEKGDSKVKKMENPLLKSGEIFMFDADKYREAVVTPWYRNQDQPQFFLVAEICWNLTPDSEFPSATHTSFRHYYSAKYGVTLTQGEQPLLDVDHTSARLNLLTPRYVNRKGVALPVSSERTRRAKRDRLDQKQILVPELCRVHPFAAPLWFATVALPCVLYRINALLIADEIRRAVAIDVGLGIPKIDEKTCPRFQWPPLDFGWSLAEVLNADSEKKHDDEDEIKNGSELSGKENGDNKWEMGDGAEGSKEKTINDILHEKETAEGFEIGTWSNDMAAAIPTEFDDFMAPLPPNLTLCTSASGGTNWCDPIEKAKSQFNTTRAYSMADSDCSYMSSDFDTDDSDFNSEVSDDDTDTSGFCSSKNENAAMGVRIEYKTTHEAEAVDLERGDVRPAPQRCPRDLRRDTRHHRRYVRAGTAPPEYIEKFHKSVAEHEKDIVAKEHLIPKDKPIVAILPQTRESLKLGRTDRELETLADRLSKQNFNVTDKERLIINEVFPYGTKEIEFENGQIQLESIEKNKRVLLAELKKSLPMEEVKKLNCFSMVDVDIDSPSYVNEKVANVGFDTKEVYIEKIRNSEKPKEFKPYFEDGKREFDFDYQPELQGHPGPSPSVILQALTMSNANDGINLERLETIGDSFLKFAITAYLYCAHPAVHEGKLSHMRSKQVSNLNLYRLGRNKRLGARMIASKFEPHDNWLPPCHKPPNTLHPRLPETEINKQTLDAPTDGAGCFIPYNLITQHSIPDKSIADCVEALIGAYLLECGPRGALLFMSWLGIRVLPRHRVPVPPPPAAAHRDHAEKPSTPSPRRRRVASTSSSDGDEGDEGEGEEEGAGTAAAGGGRAVRELAWGGPGRVAGSLRPYRTESGQWMQPVFGELKAPPSPLLRYIEDPEGELEQMLSGYDALERTLRYRFRDRSLLLQALTHASHQQNRLTDCYQRLEFLGDAILDYLITRHLYEDARRHSPGALTDLRSALVNNTIFATLAARHGFHKYFRHMSPGLNEVLTKYVRIQEENGHSISEEHYLIQEDEMEQAEDVEVPKALGDLFESVAGAIFLDSGMSLGAVWKSYVNLMGAELEAFSAAAPKSPVRELLEAEPDTAKFGKPERLADGRRVRVVVEVFGRGAFKGIGRNYRIAKGTAARCALRHLRHHRR